MAPQGVAGDLYESITGQLFELGRQLRQPNGYPFDPVMLRVHLQSAIEGRFVEARSDLYAVLVDYGMSVEELVRLGHYDWVEEGVCLHFSLPTDRGVMKTVVVEIVQFHCPPHASTDDALRWLDCSGYRPADLRELLVFGEKYPDVQREFSVVALGSVCGPNPLYDHGGSFFPYLYASTSTRRLGLYGSDSESHPDVTGIGYPWHQSWRLAAVRK